MLQHKCGTCNGNVARELDVHMSHTGPEHWKALGRLIGYLKGKNTKVIIVRKPKVIKAVMFCGSNYARNKETRNIVRVVVTTLGLELITCPLKTQRTIALSSTEANHGELSVCAQEVKFLKVYRKKSLKCRNYIFLQI